MNYWMLNSAIYVTSFSVFHTRVTVSIGHKNLLTVRAEHGTVSKPPPPSSWSFCGAVCDTHFKTWLNWMKKQPTERFKGEITYSLLFYVLGVSFRGGVVGWGNLGRFQPLFQDLCSTGKKMIKDEKRVKRRKSLITVQKVFWPAPKSRSKYTTRYNKICSLWDVVYNW